MKKLSIILLSLFALASCDKEGRTVNYLKSSSTVESVKNALIGEWVIITDFKDYEHTGKIATINTDECDLHGHPYMVKYSLKYNQEFKYYFLDIPNYFATFKIDELTNKDMILYGSSYTFPDKSKKYTYKRVK